MFFLFRRNLQRSAKRSARMLGFHPFEIKIPIESTFAVGPAPQGRGEGPGAMVSFFAWDFSSNVRTYWESA